MRSNQRSRIKGEPTELRAVGYCRVSTDHQAIDGVSLEAQQARISAWAESNGYKLEGIHSDAGISGKRADNRPGLQAALADVCRNGGALVVYALSRLARSTRDAIGIAERLEKAGADLVSLTEKIDTTTAAGKMIFRLLAVLAEFERDLASERTRAALSHKSLLRERVGEIPYGWKVLDGSNVLQPIPEEQIVISAIIEQYRAGQSLRAIALKLIERHIPTKKRIGGWTHQAVAKIILRHQTKMNYSYLAHSVIVSKTSSLAESKPQAPSSSAFPNDLYY